MTPNACLDTCCCCLVGGRFGKAAGPGLRDALVRHGGLHRTGRRRRGAADRARSHGPGRPRHLQGGGREGSRPRTARPLGRSAGASAHDIGYHSNLHSVPPHSVGLPARPGLYGRRGGVRAARRGRCPDVERDFRRAASLLRTAGQFLGRRRQTRRCAVWAFRSISTKASRWAWTSSLSGTAACFTSSTWGDSRCARRSTAASSVREELREFDRAAADLASRGGGVVSMYYHPTEFVTTEFWDAVNFAEGANPERPEWRRPRRRTEAESERCFGILRSYVAHVKSVAGRPIRDGARACATLRQPGAAARRIAFPSQRTWPRGRHSCAPRAVRSRLLTCCWCC